MGPPDPLAEAVVAIRRALDGPCEVPEGAGVLVAWSGGPDSTLLLHGLRRLQGEGRVEIAVAHVDHGLREESGEEASLLASLAGGLGLDLRTASLGLNPGPGAPGRARCGRYRTLHRIAAEVGFSLVATGHTADDQAETVLMRMLRGAGVRGLRGILPRTREGLVRPMLGLRREQVEEAILELGLPALRDPSNRDPRYLRTRIRHRVLPALEDLDAGGSLPRVRRRLGKIAAEARRLWAEVEPEIDAIAPGRALPIALLLALPDFARGPALSRWLECPVDRRHTKRILALAASTPASPARLSGPGASTLHRIGGFLVRGPRRGDPDLSAAFPDGMPPTPLPFPAANPYCQAASRAIPLHPPTRTDNMPR